jgi:hypothetical protein
MLPHHFQGGTHAHSFRLPPPRPAGSGRRDCRPRPASRQSGAPDRCRLDLRSPARLHLGARRPRRRQSDLRRQRHALRHPCVRRRAGPGHPLPLVAHGRQLRRRAELRLQRQRPLGSRVGPGHGTRRPAVGDQRVRWRRVSRHAVHDGRVRAGGDALRVPGRKQPVLAAGLARRGQAGHLLRHDTRVRVPLQRRHRQAQGTPPLQQRHRRKWLRIGTGLGGRRQALGHQPLRRRSQQGDHLPAECRWQRVRGGQGVHPAVGRRQPGWITAAGQRRPFLWRRLQRRRLQPRRGLPADRQRQVQHRASLRWGRQRWGVSALRAGRRARRRAVRHDGRRWGRAAELRHGLPHEPQGQGDDSSPFRRHRRRWRDAGWRAALRPRRLALRDQPERRGRQRGRAVSARRPEDRRPGARPACLHKQMWLCHFACTPAGGGLGAARPLGALTPSLRPGCRCPGPESPAAGSGPRGSSPSARRAATTASR